MNFIEHINSWVKSEVAQGRIMIGIGIWLLVAVYFILKGDHTLLKGIVIPIGLLTLVLIGYGSYIIYSRPIHAKKSIELFESVPKKAIEKERMKHIEDNKAGKTLMKYVYPGLMLLSVLGLFFIQGAYYKGLFLGFVILFVSTFIIDYGFVSRSDAFIEFLNSRF